VTATAIANDLRVIDPYRWGKRRDPVAILANVRRINMTPWLTDRIGVVVTTGAVRREAAMIKIGWHPTIGCMAVTAGIAARNVILWFSKSDGIIVAARTTALDL